MRRAERFVWTSQNEALDENRRRRKNRKPQTTICRERQRVDVGGYYILRSRPRRRAGVSAAATNHSAHSTRPPHASPRTITSPHHTWSQPSRAFVLISSQLYPRMVSPEWLLDLGNVIDRDVPAYVAAMHSRQPEHPNPSSRGDPQVQK